MKKRAFYLPVRLFDLEDQVHQDSHDLRVHQAVLVLPPHRVVPELPVVRFDPEVPKVNKKTNKQRKLYLNSIKESVNS